MESHPKRIDEDISARLLPDGYVVLYNTKTEWAHSGPPIAGMVWELCDGLNSVSEIKDRIFKLCPEIDPILLHQQVDDVIAEFAKAQLVRTELVAAE